MKRTHNNGKKDPERLSIPIMVVLGWTRQEACRRKSCRWTFRAIATATNVSKKLTKEIIPLQKHCFIHSQMPNHLRFFTHATGTSCPKLIWRAPKCILWLFILVNTSYGLDERQNRCWEMHENSLIEHNFMPSGMCGDDTSQSAGWWVDQVCCFKTTARSRTRSSIHDVNHLRPWFPHSLSLYKDQVEDPQNPTHSASFATRTTAWVELILCVKLGWDVWKMVNTGRPSQGCGTCRQRRIKVSSHSPQQREWGRETDMWWTVRWTQGNLLTLSVIIVGGRRLIQP